MLPSKENSNSTIIQREKEAGHEHQRQTQTIQTKLEFPNLQVRLRLVNLNPDTQKTVRGGNKKPQVQHGARVLKITPDTPGNPCRMFTNQAVTTLGTALVTNQKLPRTQFEQR